jgi:galactokinase
MPDTTIRAVAPGRVNLIGDHTDHTGGWVLPAAIDLATTVEGHHVDEPVVELRSDGAGGTARFDLPVEDATAVTPEWGRYVAGVAALLGRRRGFVGTVRSTVPIGGGLSSSAALLVGSALALGAEDSDPIGLATLCQRAEQSAVGVPCGVMDHLASISGRAGHALLIDTSELTVEPVALPDGVEVRVVDSGVSRALVGSEYAERRRRCEAANGIVGSLRDAGIRDVESIGDPLVRAAGRHVVSENRRVRDAAAALDAGDLAAFGQLMAQSHASLRDDLEVSTPVVDALVERMSATPGVIGARMTGAGFGGWVVVLCEPNSVDVGLVVQLADGASVSRGPASR